ncbi:MAG: chemotaxis protein CheW, partial [Rubripirellula sp.]
VYLSSLLGTGSANAETQAGHVNIVVLQTDHSRFGLVVDHVARTEEIVVKAIHPSLNCIPHLAGATVMGDGRVALIIAMEELKPAVDLIESPKTEQQPNQMLLFRLGSGRELAMPLAEIDRLEDIAATRLESTEQMQAVQYRGQIMPVLPLSQLLGEDTLETEHLRRPDAAELQAVKAIVINVNGNFAAIAVREIVDVAEQEGPMRVTNKPGSLIRGAAVIEGKVTEVLDLQSVLQSSGIEQHSETGASS